MNTPRLALAVAIVLFGVLGRALLPGHYTWVWHAHLAFGALIAISAVVRLGARRNEREQGGARLTNTFPYGRALWSLVAVAILAIGITLIPGTVDITSRRSHSLEPETLTLLQSLKADYQVVVLAESLGVLPYEIQHMAQEFEAESAGRIAVSVAAPEYNPELVRRFEVQAGDAALVVQGEHSIHLRAVSETGIAYAIRQFERPVLERVVFLTGEGEPSLEDDSSDGLSMAKAFLAGRGYDVSVRAPLALDGTEDLIVWIAPTQLPAEEGYRAIENAIERGARFLIAAEPSAREILNPTLRQFHVSVSDAVVIDKVQQLAASSPFLLFVQQQQAHHPIVSFLEHGSGLLFDAAASLDIEKGAAGITPLVFSSDNSWGERSLSQEGVSATAGPDDLQGPLMLVVAFESQDAKTRAIITSDSSWLRNRLFSLYGNSQLFERGVEWALHGNGGIPLPRSRRIGGIPAPIALSHIREFLLVSLAVTELLLLMGVLVWMRRRAFST